MILQHFVPVSPRCVAVRLVLEGGDANARGCLESRGFPVRCRGWCWCWRCGMRKGRMVRRLVALRVRGPMTVVVHTWYGWFPIPEVVRVSRATYLWSGGGARERPPARQPEPGAIECGDLSPPRWFWMDAEARAVYGSWRNRGLRCRSRTGGSGPWPSIGRGSTSRVVDCNAGARGVPSPGGMLKPAAPPCSCPEGAAASDAA